MFLPSLGGGGAERVFVQLANAFAGRGFDVDLALANAEGPYLEDLASAVRVVDFSCSGVLSSLPKLVRYLRTERPRVLLSGLDHANVVAIVAGLAARVRTRVVVSERSVVTAMYGYDKSLSSRLVLQLVKALYPFADSVIANSRAVREDLCQGLGIRNADMHVIYNPLDIDQIVQMRETHVDHPWTNGSAVPLVVAVGSLSGPKDFPTLIRAFSIVRRARSCRLAILGEGPDRRALEKLIDELDLAPDVVLPGFVSNPFRWIGCGTVFVSSSRTEGCPNSLMEALACGTAVVATACAGGSAEVLQDGRWGRLVPVGDEKAMAHAILETMKSEHGSDGIQRSKDFALRKIATEYLQVLIPDHGSCCAGDQS